MTASPTPFFAESANKSGTDHSPDAGNMVPASAAMPSVAGMTDRIIAFLKLRDEMVTDPDERTDDERAESAKKLAALFAPILAEKENLVCNLDAIQSDHADTLAMLIEANAERREFQARALAAEAERDALKAKLEVAVKALERIEHWHGQFPATGRFWDESNTRPMSYAACYGSNGERDFMRSIARETRAAMEAQ